MRLSRTVHAALGKAPATASQRTALVAKLLNGGQLAIYSGERPATADAPADPDEEIVRLPMGNAPPVANGRTCIEAKLTRVERTAQASWFRCYRPDGRTPVLDGVIGGAESDMTFSLETPYFVKPIEVEVTLELLFE